MIVVAIAFVFIGKSLVVVEVVKALGRHKAQVALTAYKLYLKYDLLDWIQVRICGCESLNTDSAWLLV